MGMILNYLHNAHVHIYDWEDEVFLAFNSV
jgi:hypothetical protein